ncbi:unnamed protein product [Adineta steineri]|uniref:Reverse transcriptase domain-containing protein n=1 Tax=Adineta steineri TaxID=433720 RepID=A0A819W062_9BILA|nr:unnamed protein product [Adineta steineri]
MLVNRQIRPSTCPWASPVIIYKKKDGGLRFYSKLDLKSGYFQLPIDENDKEKTAFITQDDEQCIKPTSEVITAIVNLPSTITLKDANEFLGKIKWYHKFIPNFAQVATPLYKVTNKTKPHKHEFFRHIDQQNTFETFKHLLTTSPLFLEYSGVTTSFILTTETSDIRY